MAIENETKEQRFVRIAEPRVSRACKAVSLLGNLAGSGYEYTEEQVDAMFGAVQEALDTAFVKKPKTVKFKFESGK